MPTKKAQEPTNNEATGPEVKKYQPLNLRPGKMTVFDNNKGFEDSDTAEARKVKEDRADLRGEIRFPNGEQHIVSLWKGKTAANKLKLTGSTQLLNEAGEYTKTGFIGLKAAEAREGSSLVMRGTVLLEGTSSTYVLNLYKNVSQKGLPYYSATVEERAAECIDPLTGEVFTRNQAVSGDDDQQHQDEGL